VQSEIIAYLDEPVSTSDDLGRFGKGIRAELAGFCFYIRNNWMDHLGRIRQRST
jgi:hypothetical protein